MQGLGPGLDALRALGDLRRRRRPVLPLRRAAEAALPVLPLARADAKLRAGLRRRRGRGVRAQPATTAPAIGEVYELYGPEVFTLARDRAHDRARSSACAAGCCRLPDRARPAAGLALRLRAGQAVLLRQLSLAADRFGRRHRRPAPARHRADAGGAGAAGHPRPRRRPRSARLRARCRARCAEAAMHARYLVGGAVRDRLLGLRRRRPRLRRGRRRRRSRCWPPASSRSARISRCSCIRETGEEYALARTERKSGPRLPRLRRRTPTRR